MATVPRSTEQLRRLTRPLAERAGMLTPLDRVTLPGEMGLARFRTRLPFDTNERAVASQLVSRLQAHGTLGGTGEPLLLTDFRSAAHPEQP